MALDLEYNDSIFLPKMHIYHASVIFFKKDFDVSDKLFVSLPRIWFFKKIPFCINSSQL